MFGNFDLLDDDVSAEPLSVVVLDYEEEHVLYRSRRRDKEGIYQVNLKPNQKVNLCLQNGIVTAGRGRKAPTERKHDGKARTVGFYITVQPKNEVQEILSQHDRLVTTSEDLTREISNLKNHHEFMRSREAKHRAVVEQTFSQLMMWLLLEITAVIVIAGAQVRWKEGHSLVLLQTSKLTVSCFSISNTCTFQILYFKRFLERRRYI